MVSIQKSITLLLVILLATSCLSLLTVKPANAQTIPEPTVPEFTAQYVLYTYPYEPTYTTNPFTGQREMTSSGGQISNQTIKFVVKNQPFTPYTDSNGNNIALYYNFRCKGHFGTQWTDYPFTLTEQGQWRSRYLYERSNAPPVYPASNTQNTIISIELPWLGLQNNVGLGQVDFQILALIGYPGTLNVTKNYDSIFFSFTGQSSGWSNTQTINIDYLSNSTTSENNSPSPIQTLTLTPTVPELSWLVVLPLLFSLFSIVMLLRHRKVTHG